MDVAFRLCAKVIEEWFKEKAPNDLGLFIMDDFTNKDTKNDIQNAFHRMRRKVDSSPSVRGPLGHILDDMYFGSSKLSIGIQENVYHTAKSHYGVGADGRA